MELDITAGCIEQALQGLADRLETRDKASKRVRKTPARVHPEHACEL